MTVNASAEYVEAWNVACVNEDGKIYDSIIDIIDPDRYNDEVRITVTY